MAYHRVLTDSIEENKTYYGVVKYHQPMINVVLEGEIEIKARSFASERIITTSVGILRSEIIKCHTWRGTTPYFDEGDVVEFTVRNSPWGFVASQIKYIGSSKHMAATVKLKLQSKINNTNDEHEYRHRGAYASIFGDENINVIKPPLMLRSRPKNGKKKEEA